jgi:MFS family permease
MTAGTAWASDLEGPAGAATAGAVLIVGFAIGPFASGLIAAAGQAGVRVSFEIAAAIVVVAIMIAVVAAQGADETAPATAHDLEQSTPTRLGHATGTVGVRFGDNRFHHDPCAYARRARGLPGRGHGSADRQRR